MFLGGFRIRDSWGSFCIAEGQAVPRVKAPGGRFGSNIVTGPLLW